MGHKRTVLKGTPTWLQNLCRTCDGNHSHAPWKDSWGIHTAEEAAYPLLFCQAICLCLRDSLPPHSRPRPVFLGQALPHWRDDALFLRAAVKFQPRSRVFPNLPSFFDLQLIPQSLFDTAWLRGKRPKGSVLPLHPPDSAQGQFWVACPKDPVQHMHSMSGVQRPANMLPPLGRFLEEAVDFVATCSCSCLTLGFLFQLCSHSCLTFGFLLLICCHSCPTFGFLFPLCSYSYPTFAFFFLLCSHSCPTFRSCPTLIFFFPLCFILVLLLGSCSHFIPILVPLLGSCF